MIFGLVGIIVVLLLAVFAFGKWGGGPLFAVAVVLAAGLSIGWGTPPGDHKGGKDPRGPEGNSWSWVLKDHSRPNWSEGPFASAPDCLGAARMRNHGDASGPFYCEGAKE